MIAFHTYETRMKNKVQAIPIILLPDVTKDKKVYTILEIRNRRIISYAHIARNSS